MFDNIYLYKHNHILINTYFLLFKTEIEISINADYKKFEYNYKIH